MERFKNVAEGCDSSPFLCFFKKPRMLTGFQKNNCQEYCKIFIVPLCCCGGKTPSALTRCVSKP